MLPVVDRSRDRFARVLRPPGQGGHGQFERDPPLVQINPGLLLCGHIGFCAVTSVTRQHVSQPRNVTSSQKKVTSLPWPDRLATLRRALRWDQEEMGRYLGRSREWVSRLENGRGEFGEIVVLKLEELERVQSRHANVTPEEATGAVVTARAWAVDEPPGEYLRRGATLGAPPMVAPLHPSHAGPPSTRPDCERLFRGLLDGAAQTGNPNAFPVIYDWLQQQFPVQLRTHNPGETP